MGTFVDLTGSRFGKLIVVSRDNSIHGKSKRVWWNCVCDCGKEISTTADRLRSGQTKSCGCLKVGTHTIDISNRRFGRLVAECIVGRNKHNQNIWRCKCDCGNTADVVATALMQGKTKSCGCYAIEVTSKHSLKDLTGHRFGKLLVLGRDIDRKSKCRFAYWNCRCDCGRLVSVVGSTLRSGDTKSCGCMSVNFAGSQLENEIKDYILAYNSDLLIEKSKCLDGKEIDIYLPELKLGIEYNGSAYHATENAIYADKDKYYHRDKFLLAKSKGIRLISIFDVDYERHKDEILNFIKDIITNNEKHYIPTKEFEYTNNDFDDGEWLREFGYEPIEQLEPISYTHSRGYVVYRSGTTIWRKIPR